jgi:Undecaprenyl-phosphate glucose phosphotransferase
MTAFDVRDLMSGTDAASTAAKSDTSLRAMHPLAEEIAAMPVQQTYSAVVISGLVRLAEFIVVALTGLAVNLLYLGGGWDADPVYMAGIPCIASLTVVVFQSLGCYDIPAFRSVARHGLRLVGGWSIVFLVALAILFFAKVGDNFSRVWLAGWYVAGLTIIIIGRIALSYMIRGMTRSGRLDRRTAIVGGGEAGERLIRAMVAQPDSGFRLIGVFDDRDDDRSPDLVGGFPKLGAVDDLVEFARRTQLDLVIFTLPISAETRILAMLRKLWVLPIDIRLAAHSSKLRLRPRSYSYIGAVPVLDVFDKPMADWDLILKWAFDKVVGTLILILVSPLMLATALAVKLDSKGPVFFRQKRYGFNNDLIEVFKFRSMYVDQCDATASKLVTKGDPRVTRVGRFIRKTSLDELPQLFNVVFKSNLSLAGPRPHAIHARAENRLYDQVVDGYFARHKVKPGITGWAQINGWRGETDTEEKIQRRVEHDLFYIENWSVFFDLYIIASTPFALLKTESAY